MSEPEKPLSPNHTFSGHIYIFHAFDVGEDISLEKVERQRAIRTIPSPLPKHFKNYQAPLTIELPHPNESARCEGVQLHNFGGMSLMYKIPFHNSLENVRQELLEASYQYQEQSVSDAKLVFKKIEKFIHKPRFYQTRSTYSIVQVNPLPKKIGLDEFQKEFGSEIASMIRFETETLSEYQKNEILDSAIGYYRGNLILVDTDATFVYDDEYRDLLSFVEFANLQQLELHFFDRQLDVELNKIYESGGSQRIPLLAYFPFIDTLAADPVAKLGKLKVDISVITERLEGSVKTAGDPYYSEFYQQLMRKLDIKSWQDAIERKLEIIKDVQLNYQHKTDVIRENILEVLIIILIFIELVLGIFHYFKD